MALDWKMAMRRSISWMHQIPRVALWYTIRQTSQTAFIGLAPKTKGIQDEDVVHQEYCGGACIELCFGGVRRSPE